MTPSEEAIEAALDAVPSNARNSYFGIALVAAYAIDFAAIQQQIEQSHKVLSEAGIKPIVVNEEDPSDTLVMPLPVRILRLTQVMSALQQKYNRLFKLVDDLRCAACCKKIVFFTPDSVVGNDCYQALQQENERMKVEFQVAGQDVLLKLAAALERVAELETYKQHHKTCLELAEECHQEMSVERRVNSALRERLRELTEALRLAREANPEAWSEFVQEIAGEGFRAALARAEEVLNG